MLHLVGLFHCIFHGAFLDVILRLEFFKDGNRLACELLEIFQLISHIELAAVGIIDVGCDFFECLDVAAQQLCRREVCKVGGIIRIDFIRRRARIAGLLLFLLALFPLFAFLFFFLFALLHQPEEDEPPLGQFEVNRNALA